MSADPSRTGRELWRYVEHADDGSGWWQLARLTRWDDGRMTLETNTRSSVVPTEVTLDAEAVAALLEALR